MALEWAKTFASENRRTMMRNILNSFERSEVFPSDCVLEEKVVDCHHNYVDKENHFGSNVWVTRKGAVRARVGDTCIILGSMGDRSYICEGKGNKDSFQSCSHGAGRVMSRTEAKKVISLKEHEEATKGVECRKDSSVLDESPAAYKSIDAVMAAQTDLVSIKHTLRQVVCVKG